MPLLVFAARSAAAQPQPTAPACSISGTVTAAGRPLPGVALALVSADDQTVDATATAPDGTYSLKAPRRSPGAFVLKAQLLAFAPVSQPVAIDASHCPQRLDLTLTLASRAAAAASNQQRPRTASAVPDAARTTQGGQAPRARGPSTGQPFQSLALLADQGGGRDEATSDTEATAQPLLPPGFSADTSAESVATLGSSQSAERVGFGDRAEFFAGGPGGNGPGGPGDGPAFGPGGGRPGFGGGPGGSGGPGGFGGPGPFAARLRNNQIRGSIFQNFDTSALDAAPFSLNGQPTHKADYLQEHFGATMGGPLSIPHVVNSPTTFFFLNYSGNHSRNPYDAYSTVPTAAERAGDLSAVARTAIDPLTGQPFAGNQIPAVRLDPSSQALLSLIPLPNGTGTRQNFHFVTTTSSSIDDVNLRLVHNFGDMPQPGGGRGRFGPGGGRGPGLAGANIRNLNVGVHYHRADSDSPTAFPTVGGTSSLTAWDVPVGFTFTKWGVVNTIRGQFNWQRSTTTNLFANSQNVAGAAGINGASTDPFDWGAPNLSFATFSSLTDLTPSLRTNQTLAVGNQMIKAHGRHVLRWGGDYRDIRADSRSDPNARGTFVFTGLYTGLDFADFLLGLPQQSTVQYGVNGLEKFDQRSWDLYLQDDWRARDTLTLNLGLRYDYVSPFTEAQNRLVNLDVAPGFTAAVPVVAGMDGPFSGATPVTVVQPDRNNFAPRVGVAWRPSSTTVVRAGYGINYSTGVYQTIAQQLANQPPFAVTNTILSSATSPVLMSDALIQPATAVTTNSYGVDPSYTVPWVQIWNVDLQRDLTRSVNVGIGYTGTKGTSLDLVRAPNRGPSGPLIPDVVPFLWESSQASSIMHSMTLRIRKRLTGGIAAGASYTLSKSMDDASSIGGGATVVAQNDQNLAAEWGLSSFDQRHRFGADFTFELPFGPDKRWANRGSAAALLGGWVVNANAQFATGTPFTARVLSNVSDVAQGVNGTLRANYNGAPIAIADPTTALYFDTSAFSIPAPGTFGSAGRNTIEGPGTSNVNLGVTRNVTIGQNRILSFQLMASNVFNTPQYSAIDTVVNSPTFGQVIAARAPRRVTVTTRFRF